MSKIVCLVKDSRCGTRAGAKAHVKHGEYVCPPCDAANRAYHREHGKIPNKVRQRTLTELKLRHPMEFVIFMAVHRAQVDAEIGAMGESVRPKIRSNRIRQRALSSLGKEFDDEYQRIYTDKFTEVLTEEE